MRVTVCLLNTDVGKLGSWENAPATWDPANSGTLNIGPQAWAYWMMEKQALRNIVHDGHLGPWDTWIYDMGNIGPCKLSSKGIWIWEQGYWDIGP